MKVCERNTTPCSATKAVGRSLFASTLLILAAGACTAQQPAPIKSTPEVAASTAAVLPKATATDAPSANPSPTTSPTPDALPASRLASHLFVPVGETRSIAGLGRLLETIYLTDPPAVTVEADSLTAATGGQACLRFAYRERDDENTVQTLCVVAFDETGACERLERMSLNLNQFLDASPELAGNANLLEAGEGRLYATCRTQAGAYRLQQPDRPLPTLYFNMVDALSDGAYSLGDAELPAQRAGVVTTFSGTTLRPPWIVTMGYEVQSLHLNDDLSLEFEFAEENCNVSPTCTFNPDIVQPGDILRISVGLGGDLTDALYTQTPQELRDRFFQDRIGVGPAEFAAVHPDAGPRAFQRLVALEATNELVLFFGDLLGVREKGVVVAYWQSLFPLPYPYVCFPDDIVPGETERCNQIEAAIQAEEARRISELRDVGYELWYSSAIGYGAEGEYLHFGDYRPHYSNFSGILGSVGASSSVAGVDIPAALANAVSQFAAEIGPEVPVVLHQNGPPITAQTGSGFCEADICPSDFKGMYEQTEAALDAALTHLTPAQFRGFGVAIFEGSHFDIRNPHEQFQFFALNRVGETGYNNPVLNIYRANP